MSNIERVDPKVNLTFRGERIYEVMMEEMLAKGMRNSHKAMLVGTSAGGLATLLHCDKFRKLFPNTTRVKCISDAGIFIHGNDAHPGDKSMENIFANTIKTHELASSLPPTCTSKRNSSLCLFPEYFVEDIQTPLFILQSAFDSFQLGSLILADTTCGKDLTSCNSTELGILRDFRSRMIRTLRVDNSSSRGLFVHSCYLHDHILLQDEWTCLSVANTTMRKAVGEWYFGRSSFREIDMKTDLPRNCTDSFCQHSRSSRPTVYSGMLPYVITFIVLIHQF